MKGHAARMQERLREDPAKASIRRIRPSDPGYDTRMAMRFPWLLLKPSGTSDEYGLAFNSFERAVQCLKELGARPR